MSKAWDEIVNESRKKGSFNVKEFLSRSEGPELFTTLLNDKLMEGLGEFQTDYMQIYDEVRITEGNTISFPSVRGMQPDMVPELSEYRFTDWSVTAVQVSVEKFGVLCGISREMIEDNQVGLIARRMKELGRAHAQLRNDEHIKCLSYFSTESTTFSTGIVGRTNRGVFYPHLGYTNVVTATDQSWEVKIARAIDRLWTQQITVQGMLVNFPVQPDFIVANPSQMIPLKKVLGTLMTVAATGVGSPGSPFGDRTQLAGNNVFAGILPIQIFSPIMPTAQAIIGKSKRGTVTLRKSDFAVEEQNAFSFDATMLKASERFMPAVIEDRFLCDVVFTG